MSADLIPLVVVGVSALAIVGAVLAKFSNDQEPATVGLQEDSARLQTQAKADYGIKLVRRDIQRLLTDGGMLILDDKAGIVYDGARKQLLAVNRTTGTPVQWSPEISKNHELEGWK